MKKITLFGSLAILLAIVSFSFNFKSSGGKAGFTGSPGENTCAQCHNSFALNAGSGSIHIESEALEALQWQYMADSTYTLQVKIAHQGATLFGFGFEALSENNENAGQLNIFDAAKTQLMNANVSGVSRTNITHKKDAGVAVDTLSFQLKWTAPDHVNTVTFYAAGNAANQNGSSSGDYIYTTSKLLTRYITPADTTSIADEKAVPIRIFPNPASAYISLNLPSQVDDFFAFVYTSSGKLVATQLIQTFDVSYLQKGIYIVQVTDTKSNPIAYAQFVKL